MTAEVSQPKISRPMKYPECKDCPLAGGLINKIYSNTGIVYRGQKCKFYRLERISVICTKGRSSLLRNKQPTMHAVYSGVLDLQRHGYDSNKWVRRSTKKIDISEKCEGLNPKYNNFRS